MFAKSHRSRLIERRIRPTHPSGQEGSQREVGPKPGQALDPARRRGFWAFAFHDIPLCSIVMLLQLGGTRWADYASHRIIHIRRHGIYRRLTRWLLYLATAGCHLLEGADFRSKIFRTAVTVRANKHEYWRGAERSATRRMVFRRVSSNRRSHRWLMPGIRKSLWSEPRAELIPRVLTTPSYKHDRLEYRHVGQCTMQKFSRV